MVETVPIQTFKVTPFLLVSVDGGENVELDL